VASNNVAAVKEVYDLARRSRHKELRELLADDVTWYPAREGAWNPCVNADQVVRTLLWRTSANRMRPAEMIDVGDRVFIRLRRSPHLTLWPARLSSISTARCSAVRRRSRSPARSATGG
jgi:hypothetical protein